MAVVVKDGLESFNDELEGWVSVYKFSKLHYVREQKSLCGRMLYLGRDPHLFYSDNEKPGEKRRDDCAVCYRKRVLEISKEEGGE